MPKGVAVGTQREGEEGVASAAEAGSAADPSVADTVEALSVALIVAETTAAGAIIMAVAITAATG